MKETEADGMTVAQVIITDEAIQKALDALSSEAKTGAVQLVIEMKGQEDKGVIVCTSS